jgi:hypothetical protein
MYCPSCHAGLCIRERYARVMGLATLTIAAGVAFALGLRGGGLLWGIALLSIPVALAVRFVNVRIFPVELEATSDVRGVLFGPPPFEPERDDVALDTWPPAEVGGPALTEDDHRRQGVPRFTLLKPARTIDGTFLRIAVVLLVGFSLWNGAWTFVYWVFPDRVATLGGPEGFAVRAMVGADGVVFVNDSVQPWACTVTIGAEYDGTRAVTSFRVEGGQQHRVEYRAFDPTVRSARMRERQRAARERMMAHCADGAGRRYLEHLR